MRLPYDTIISVNDDKYRKDVKLHPHYIFDWDAERWDAKPYLRPLSSMTKEEAIELAELSGFKNILSVKINQDHLIVEVDDGVCSSKRHIIWFNEIVSSIGILDWLLKNHFDFRSLIELGLAMPAPEGMYEPEK